MPRRVKDFIDISEYTSLDDLIRYLETIRDNLPPDIREYIAQSPPRLKQIAAATDEIKARVSKLGELKVNELQRALNVVDPILVLGPDNWRILSADQVYRMDFRRLRQTHRDSGADVTVAVLPVTRERVGGVGVVRLDDAGRVTGLVEKPQRDEQLEPFRTADAWL